MKSERNNVHFREKTMLTHGSIQIGMPVSFLRCMIRESADILFW